MCESSQVIEPAFLSEFSVRLHDPGFMISYMIWKPFPHHWPFERGIHRSPVGFPHKRPIKQRFDVPFDVGSCKLLNKQSRGWACTNKTIFVVHLCMVVICPWAGQDATRPSKKGHEKVDIRVIFRKWTGVINSTSTKSKLTVWSTNLV